MPLILRVSLLVTISIILSIIHQHPHLTDDSVHAVSMEYVRNAPQDMLPFIKLLGLDKLETDEERRKAISIDFHTLPAGIPADEKMQAKILLNFYFYGQSAKLREKAENLHQSDRAKYDLEKFNTGIVALGVKNFMTAAIHFCEEEGAGGAIDIVSVGSGDGTIERAVMAEYRSRYGKDLPPIKLVDPDSAFNSIVDFKTVDHLIKERPNMIRNCVLFIIWPLPASDGLLPVDRPEPYDIEAVRKLKPRAVFVVYEYTGVAGSDDLRTFLQDKKLDESIPPDEFGIQNWAANNLNHYYEKKNYGLDRYKITEIAHQKIFFQGPGTYIFRMVKLKRGGSEHDQSDL